MKRLHFYVGKYDLIDEAEAVYKRVRVLYKGFCALIYPNPDATEIARLYVKYSFLNIQSSLRKRREIRENALQKD